MSDEQRSMLERQARRRIEDLAAIAEASPGDHLPGLLALAYSRGRLDASRDLQAIFEEATG